MNNTSNNKCCEKCAKYAMNWNKTSASSTFLMCENAACECHIIKASTPSSKVEKVIIAQEGTLMAEFQKERTDGISQMFDNKYADGIYPTSRFFKRLDDCVERLLIQQRKDIVERIAAETIRPKKGVYNASDTKIFNYALQVAMSIVTSERD